MATEVEALLKSMRMKVVGQKRQAVYDDRFWAVDEPLSTTVEYRTENVYVVEIPEKELETMVDVRNWYKDNLSGYNIERFDQMITDHYHERNLRAQDPRLKELYDQYTVLLALISDRQYLTK